jgi:5,10-methylenetetrahydromethanopterin reductase
MSSEGHGRGSLASLQAVTSSVNIAAGIPAIGMCFDRGYPAAAVREFAERLEKDGLDELWIIEDCFYTAGISLAATALARTERLRVGLGILPAVARTAAVTAMELATLAELAPGRVLAGIGHGVQEWMAQMGVRTNTPVNTLEEVIVNVKRLLKGEEVTFTGKHVTLDRVKLDAPPAHIPPVLSGVRGPKSLAMSGLVADGLVLAECTSPAAVRQAREQAGRTESSFHVAVFAPLCVMPNRKDAYQIMAPMLAGLIDQEVPALRATEFYEEMAARYKADGTDGLASMPAEWWTELGPIGTMDDAIAHVRAVGEAGAQSVALFPAPALDVGRQQLAQVAEIKRALT